MKPESIKAYLWHAKKFLAWLGQKALDQKNIKKYHQFIVHSSEKINSINLHLVIVNDYLKFLKKKLKFNLLTQKNTPATTLTKQQLQKFLDLPLRTPGLVGLRNKALLEILYCTGLKVGRVSRLKINELDEIKNELIIENKLHIAIDTIPWSALQKYLQARHDENEYIFINFDRSNKSKKGHISTRSIERIVQNYSGQLALDISVSPQILRNTLAHNLKKDGALSLTLLDSLHFHSKLAAQNFWKRV